MRKDRAGTRARDKLLMLMFGAAVAVLITEAGLYLRGDRRPILDDNSKAEKLRGRR